jgi:hypothetical protein
MFHTKVVEEIKTHISYSIFICVCGKSYRLWDNVEKILYRRTDHTRQYIMMHAHFMLDTKGCKHTLQNMQYLLLFHCNTGCTNAPQCYIIHILSVLLIPQSIFNAAALRVFPCWSRNWRPALSNTSSYNTDVCNWQTTEPSPHTGIEKPRGKRDLRSYGILRRVKPTFRDNLSSHLQGSSSQRTSVLCHTS